MFLLSLFINKHSYNRP